MTRFRDLTAGLTVGHLPTGAHNALTDVPGVRVGHLSRIEGDGPLRPGQGPIRTGVTAILPHPGDLFREKVVAAVHTINGYGKALGFEQVRELGVIETPILLTNTLNVPRVADALISYMIARHPDIGIRTSTVNPIVGECNDGLLNDIQGRHIHAEHVEAVLAQAHEGPQDHAEEGNVGAGTGTVCYHFKGGIGTASRRVEDRQNEVGPFTLGVLVQTNFGARHELRILGAPIGEHFSGELLPQVGPGSIMVVVATDAPLEARQLGRVARRVTHGLARTGTLTHDGSGDFVIAFSTAGRHPHEAPTMTRPAERFNERGRDMDRFFRAVVEATEEAIYNALTTAETLSGRDGNTLHALPHARLLELLRHYRRI